jgi:tetratricopeptide (TPR) repeat protein
MTLEQSASADDEATEEIHPIANAQEQATARDNRESWFTRLRARFSGAQARRTYTTERLIALTRAIERHPESAVNYVARGELYLEIDERERAAADFRQALALAEVQYAEDDWGLVSQAVQDRAVAGLTKIGL